MFVWEKYGVKFLLFEKIMVNGVSVSLLYKYLKEFAFEFGLFAMVGLEIKWNFVKFLFDKDGKMIVCYVLMFSFFSIEGDIIKVF